MGGALCFHHLLLPRPHLSITTVSVPRPLSIQRFVRPSSSSRCISSPSSSSHRLDRLNARANTALYLTRPTARIPLRHSPPPPLPSYLSSSLRSYSTTTTISSGSNPKPPSPAMTIPLRTSGVERVADALEKPALDTRTYRVIRLDNDLEALLIHDPETDKAAAAMDVNVGSFSDSEDMPGIAHAVEHLLFMGTEKYPGENDYNSYLTKYAGHSNAFTSSCSTNYFFELSATSSAASKNGANSHSDIPISNDKAPLYGALDRFSQFFINPLFLEDTLDRELRAVDSENKKNLQADNWRLNQLNKSTSSKDHPFHKFSTGNYKVLHDDPIARGVKIRDEFIKFYKKNYSANQMKLTILGVESLDQLESWAIEFFSAVPNQNLPQRRWDGIPVYDEAALGTQTFAKPVMDTRMLSLDFPYPDEQDLYASQPVRYISHLIGHEGPGSILAYLKKEKGWANALGSGVSTPCPGTAFFNIDVSLTDSGLENYTEVLKAIFQYIAMLKEQPPHEWIADEMKKLSEVDFRFQQKAPASSTVSSLSGRMQKPLPREWLLSGQSIVREFDPANIRRGINSLRPDNFRFTIVSQSTPGDWDLKEQWYGTEYKYEKIPADLMRELETAASAPADARPVTLHLPAVNEFVPRRLDVEKKEVKEPIIIPTLIRNDDGVRTWFKKDDQFWVPKANLFVTLRIPTASSTPFLTVLTGLYMSLVSDSLEEYAYDAELAGLEYNLNEQIDGMAFSIQGYNDKMAVLLDKFLHALRHLEITQERFDIVKERRMRQWKNNEYRDPFRQIFGYVRWLMLKEGGSWIDEQLREEIVPVTVADVQAFVPQLLKQMHIEVLAHGNLHREEALAFSKQIESTLKPHRLPPKDWPVRRAIRLQPGDNFVYKRPLRNPDNVNHCLNYTLVIAPQTSQALRARLLLFEKLIDEPCFDTLRTKEQLGYVVWSGSVRLETELAWRVLVQSERDCGFLEQRCDAFLTGFRRVLEEIDEGEFVANKVGLINKRLEKAKNLDQETGRFWARVVDETLDFELADKDVASIETLTKTDLLAFYDTYIAPISSTRAKLSVHLVAQASSPTTTNGTSEDTINGDAKEANGIATEANGTTGESSGTLTQTNGTLGTLKKTNSPVLIEDVRAWKDSMALAPAPRPVKDVSEFEEVGAKL